jgi:superfamily I DNA and/or RNA helicase
MQVNLLKQRLPAGARVGTVDKFQGQEAAAVLVSMASSSATTHLAELISCFQEIGSTSRSLARDVCQ